MSDARGEELLAAIRAAPDDRALRLVYADWLMERGDPRGEWIALSCGQGTEDTDQEMRRRALWQHHGQRWEHEDRVRFGLAKIVYRDGFPDTAELVDDSHLKSPHTLPPLRALEVWVTGGSLRQLENSPLLETVRSVKLSGALEQAGAREILEFLHAPGLDRLEALAMCSDHDEMWSALERFSRLGELKRLELHARMSLIQADWLGAACPALEELQWQGVSYAPLDYLIDAATFRLQAVALIGAGPERYLSPNDAAFARLLAAPLASQLTSLTLLDMQLGRETADALARSACASTLRLLRTHMRDPAFVQGLYDCELPALETLGILDALSSKDDVVDVVTGYPALTALEVTHTTIEQLGAEQIMSSLPRLERLSLDRGVLDDESVDAIAWSEQARSLRHLSLEGARVNGTGITSIVGSGRLGELRSLSLSGNQLEHGAVRLLADGPFDRMARLCVRDTMHAATAPLFAHAWKRTAESDTYERKLELSGRAVAR